MKKIGWRCSVICKLIACLAAALLAAGCGSTGATTSQGSGSTGSGGTLSTSSSAIAFGNVPVGTAVTQTLTFTNSSSVAVHISSAQVTGAGFSIVPPPTLPLTIAAGQSVSAVVQVLPTAAGPMNGTITVGSDATPSTVTLNLSATGVTTTGTTFSIAGAITPASLAAGSTLTLSGNGVTPSSVTADSNGNFTFAGVSNGTYTITPSNGNAIFSPASSQVTVSGANVSAVNFSFTFTLSGSLGSAGTGATVTLSGAASATTTADGSGNFSFNGLANGSYTVTPTKSNVVFNPASQQVTISGANLNGVNFSETFSISGSISPSSTGANVTVKLSGAASRSVTSDASGNYSFTGLSNGSYTVTPTSTSITFSPASQAVSINNATVTGISFTASGQLSVSPASFNFGSLTVGTTSQPQTVTLSAVGGNVTVTADTLSGAGFGLSGLTFPLTISSGQSTSGSLTFAPTNGGSASGSLSFANGGVTIGSATLSGTGVGLSLTGTSLNFSQVADGTSSAPQTATLTAVGASVTVNSVNLTQSGGGGAAFSITGLTLPLTLAAGQSQNFSVVFAPAAGSPGTASATATFASSANSVNQTMAGTGTANVLLAWGASTTPSVTYNVYRCSSSAASCVSSQPGNFTEIGIGVASLAYTDASVASGQTYYYAVTAVAGGSESVFSSVSGGAVIP